MNVYCYQLPIYSSGSKEEDQIIRTETWSGGGRGVGSNLKRESEGDQQERQQVKKEEVAVAVVFQSVFVRFYVCHRLLSNHGASRRVVRRFMWPWGFLGLAWDPLGIISGSF